MLRMIAKDRCLLSDLSHSLGTKLAQRVWSGATALLVVAVSSSAFGQTGGLVGTPSRLGTETQVRTTEYNSEWVESSSPVAGGVVSTTHFPGTGNTITTVRENVVPAGAYLTSAPLPQQAAPNYAAIPTGNGNYLVPTVQYVPMNSGVAAGTPYQVAAVPYGTCASCQTQMLTQPTAFQPGMVQQPFANQQPVLAPQSGGVYGPIQQPGFYPVAPAQPQSGQGGYKSLIPRALPAGTYISQGWAGQPKAFVSNQPFRNFIRYLTIP
ncbi:MAG: hypothetical protein JNL67_23010 [Planctomycetaceae bacterium]|nr:hypothetical protein [Planctomycetaceae bacterium]